MLGELVDKNRIFEKAGSRSKLLIENKSICCKRPPRLLFSCSINKKAYTFNKSLVVFISYLSNYSYQKKKAIKVLRVIYLFKYLSQTPFLINHKK